VDLAAPGQDILSTIPTNAYKKLSGTSMATPLVAGAVALIIAEAQTHSKNLTPQEIKGVLQSSGAAVKIDTACKCRIDVAAALTTVRDNALVVLPNAASMALKGTTKFTGLGGKAPFTFASSNPTVAAIAADGTLTAASKGETVVTVTDAAGAKAMSRSIYVGAAAPKDPGGSCPLNPPQLCDILCKINPNLPWCSKI
jgi:subtilisin family serine protease